jgi:hypothetical protein
MTNIIEILDLVSDQFPDGEKETKKIDPFEFNHCLPEKYIKRRDKKLLNNLNGLLELCSKYKDYNNKEILTLRKIENELIDLNNLIGLKELKKMICSQILFLIQNKKSSDMMHTVLYGDPGCGKTTLGKLLGKIFLKIGHIKNNNFILAKRSDLIAGYVGQTAIKTQKLIDKAKGGVLFIDEVYSLGNHEKKTDSFEKECIDTLNQNLTEQKFVCIIAGYEQEVMKCFFQKNEGLKRRFPWVYKIDKMTSHQLYLIFLEFLRRNHWGFNQDDLDELEKFFHINLSFFPYNGGSIETFFSKLKIYYYQIRFGTRKPKRQKRLFDMNDIKKSFEIYKKFEIKKDKSNPPPPFMYI